MPVDQINTLVIIYQSKMLDIFFRDTISYLYLLFYDLRRMIANNIPIIKD